MPATIGQEASRWPRKHFKYLEPDRYCANASMKLVRVRSGTDGVLLFLAMRLRRWSDTERVLYGLLSWPSIVNGAGGRGLVPYIIKFRAPPVPR
jgi:hypothetical protein